MSGPHRDVRGTVSRLHDGNPPCRREVLYVGSVGWVRETGTGRLRTNLGYRSEKTRRLVRSRRYVHSPYATPEGVGGIHVKRNRVVEQSRTLRFPPVPVGTSTRR